MKKLLFLIGVAGLAAFGRLAAPGPEPIVAGSVTVAAPEVIEAGDDLEVIVRAAVPDSTQAVAFFRSAYRTAEVAVLIDKGRAVVMAPRGVTAAAGLLEIVIRVGTAWSSVYVDVQPGAVFEPPVPLVGARSLVAGDQDRSLVVVIPADAHGNPVPGATITVTSRWPEASTAVISTRRESSLQWAWIPGGRIAGRLLVTTAAESIPGLERRVRVVPAEVQDVSFDVTDRDLRADGVSFLTLTTDPLIDRYGNLVLDGTAVVVESTSPSGARAFQTVTTVNGVARAILEAPAEPGLLEITVIVGRGKAHRSVVLSPALAARVPTMKVERRPGPDLVHVGPVVGDLGQLVPDGTEVRVVATSTGSTGKALTWSGVALVSLDVDGTTSVTVEIGGSVFEIPVEDPA